MSRIRVAMENVLNQTTSKLLMIEPVCFGFNEEAYLTNSFQNRPSKEEQGLIQGEALKEFKLFVSELQKLGVEVTVYRDVLDSKTPDSIFPNNWISTHQTGELVTYPMAVSNRRSERRYDVINKLIELGYSHIDYSEHEKETNPTYLEGTGSMLFDHMNKEVYAAISGRTNLMLLNKVGDKLGYKVVSFTSYGKENELIYHTNVMLCIGRTFACIGANSINEEDRQRVLNSLQAGGKELLLLTNDQVYNHFAGNMLQIQNIKGESILVMSNSAYDSLTEDQQMFLEKHNDHLLHVNIPTIERIGGGSARCMLAEIFIPKSINLKS